MTGRGGGGGGVGREGQRGQRGSGGGGIHNYSLSIKNELWHNKGMFCFALLCFPDGKLRSKLRSSRRK